MPEQNFLYFKSRDDLQLFAKEYVNSSANEKILCLHGITRNCSDFEGLCENLKDDYHVIAADQRGRGKSDYDPNFDNYFVGTYVIDMFTLLDNQSIEEVFVIGTSMGGIMAMMMAVAQPKRIKGIVLNDIGPEVDESGLDRIKSYLGKSSPVNNWEEATAHAKKINALAFPDFTNNDWLSFAKRLYRENENGVPELAYDPAIAKPLANTGEAAAPPDLWSMFEALTDIPMLLIRGELSDILSSECVSEMQHRKPDMVYQEITNRGHAPMLDEAESLSAIKKFLSSLSSR